MQQNIGADILLIDRDSNGRPQLRTRLLPLLDRFQKNGNRASFSKLDLFPLAANDILKNTEIENAHSHILVKNT